jgi:hypothetical protein
LQHVLPKGFSQPPKYWSTDIIIADFLHGERHCDQNLPQTAIAAGDYPCNGLLETSNGKRVS